MKDERVAPNIYRTFRKDGSVLGWRVYVKRDGVLRPRRFKPDATLEQLQLYVETFHDESQKLRRERAETEQQTAGTLRADVARYLRLATVKAMPSYIDRTRELQKWVDAMGARARPSITARELDEQLQAFLDSGLSGSTVNKLRTALMSLWTRLDGRGAANPVRETRVFEEAEEEPRGRSYALLKQILDTVPDRARPIKGQKGSTKRGSVSKVRLEIMAWTGMAPVQVARLKEGQHFNIAEGWYVMPRREKGRKSRFPRPVIRKQMTADAKAAFKRFVKLKAEGPFDRRSLRHTWLRAVANVEKALREKTKNPRLSLARFRLYDIRHSFATELMRVTKNRRVVQDALDHASDRTTRRYALGAVPEALKGAMEKFERAAGRRRK